MWKGYLRFGEAEVANISRTLGYAASACPVPWLWDAPNPGLRPYLNHSEYVAANMADAPWWDANDVATQRFYGLTPVDLVGISDSSREVPITQGLLAGGTAGQERLATKTVRMRAYLTGRGHDSIEAAMVWLDSVMSQRGCAMHGGSCGIGSLTFFTAAPPNPTGMSSTAFTAEMKRLTRHLHKVKGVSGPLVLSEFARADVWSRLVEISFEATDPHLYGETREITLPPATPRVAQDAAINLITYPSAELTAGTVTASTSYPTNPSVETNATGWAADFGVVSGTSPSSLLTSGQSSDIAASGTQSFRNRLLGSGSGSTTGRSYLYDQQSVAVSPATGQRYSVTIWAAVLIAAGAGGSTINGLLAELIWKNGSGTVLRTDNLGSASSSEYGGRVFSGKSIAPPAGTASVLVRVRADVSWNSSATPANNSDIRLYADALALTTP